MADVVYYKEQLEPITLSRDHLEKFYQLPNFQDILCGCFVRISLAPNHMSLAQIVETIVDEKIMMKETKHMNLRLKLKLDGRGRTKIFTYRPQFVSDKTCMQAEFDKWKNRRTVYLPTIDYVQEKWKQVKQAMQDSGMAKKLRSSTKKQSYADNGDKGDCAEVNSSRRRRSDQERKQMMLRTELLPRIKSFGLPPPLAEKIGSMFLAISNQELLRMMFDNQSLKRRVSRNIFSLHKVSILFEVDEAIAALHFPRS